MPTSLSVANIIEKNKLSSTTPYLPALDIEVVNPSTKVVEETLHVVRNAEDVNYTYNGNLYVATAFEISFKHEKGSMGEVRLTFKDYSRALQARMQAYGGGIGFNVTLMVLNADQLTEAPEIIEYFQVIGANSSNYNVEFTLGAENALSFTFPRRRQMKDFCQWRYKSTFCGYSGPIATCDLTLQGPNGCAAHNNTPNFGGFPGINTGGIRYV